jgi:hypothetical protein
VQKKCLILLTSFLFLISFASVALTNPGYTITVATDKMQYAPGETVVISGELLEDGEGVDDNCDVAVQIAKAGLGTVSGGGNTKTYSEGGTWGKYTYQFVPVSGNGHYTVTVSGGGVNQEASFIVGTTPEQPVANPAAGTYYQAQSVVLTTATAGADIYYTLNGNDPDATSTKYTAPISISENKTIKAVAIINDVPSAIATFAYTIAEVAQPVADPAAGTYPLPQVVTLTTVTAGAEIYYTVDGSDPDKTSTKYTGPFAVNPPGPVTVRAVAIAQGSSSAVADFEYVFADNSLLTSFTAIPNSEISYTRPAIMNGQASKSVAWTVEVFSPLNSKVGSFTSSGDTFHEEWKPVDAYQPSGTYTIKVTVKDALGITAQNIYNIKVYNYPLKVEDIKITDFQGNEQGQFQPDQFYQVKVTVSNLEPVQETPLTIVQTLDNNNLPVNLGSTQVTVDKGNSATMSVGAQSPVKLGTYTAEAFVWNMWPSQATEENPHRILSAPVNITFEVVES